MPGKIPSRNLSGDDDVFPEISGHGDLGVQKLISKSHVIPGLLAFI